LIVLGYAAYSWRRALRKREGSEPEPKALPSPEVAEPLAARLEHVPDEAALDSESEPLPANSNSASHGAELGALFLGRASAALSPFQFGPDWPQGSR
jgi:hypothetical protein